MQGWRHVKVTARRTAQAVAHWMQDLVDVHVPAAAVGRVVLDHLHTHPPAAVDATLPPAEACRILRQWAFHSTPTHGRWLNRAAIDVAVVSTQGLDRRLADSATVRRTIAAWDTCRHAAKATADWRVTTAKARRTLQHVDP